MSVSSSSKTALAVAIALGLSCATSVAAEGDYNYPVDTVKLVTHSKPGAGSDLFLRKLSKELHEEMGVNFVVDYWSGGSGAKAMAELVKAPADGSVFYATTPTHITTSILSEPAVTYKDIDYIANVFFDPEVVFTRAESPFNSMKEAVDFSKAHPGEAKWGGASPGSLERQILERINAKTDAKAIVVPHDDGSGLLVSVLNGTVDLGVGEMQELRQYIDAGQMKVIGVAYPERLSQIPDVPTIVEMGLDDDVIRKFRGLAAPKGVPADTVRQIEKAIQGILADPEFKKEYEADSLVPGYMGQDEYRAFMAKFAKTEEDFLAGYGVTGN